MNINAKVDSLEFKVVPKVKQVLVQYVSKDSSAQDAYKKIKEISMEAISYIQSDGEISSSHLDELIAVISRKLEHEAIFLNKDQVITSIISAINS